MVNIGKALLIFLFSLFSLSFASDFVVSVDKTNLSINESLNLTLKVIETDFAMPKPDEPILQGFEIVGKSVYTSTNYQLINGKSTKSKTVSYKYSLKPTKIGKIVIPALSLTSNGKKFITKKITITVTKNIPKNATSQNSPVYIKTTVDKKNVFVGQKIVVNYFVYTKVNISGIQNIADPEFNGFWSKQIFAAKEIKFKQEIINGIPYGKMLLYSYQITPKMTGKLKTPALKIKISSRQTSGDFFGFGTTKNYTITGKTINIQAKNLPTRPENFGGSIGEFTIKSWVNKSNVSLGDALTFNIEVRGVGSFNDDFPKFSQNEHFRFTQPELTNGKSIYAAKYMVIAKKIGKFFIPSISFKIFDPKSKKYKNIQTKPIKIVVDKNPLFVYANSQIQQKVKQEGKDIDFIIANVSGKPYKIFFHSFNYWFLYLLSSLSMGIAFFFLKRYKYQKGDANLQRQRKADRIFRKYIKNASSFAKIKKKEFYPEAHTGLVNFLCDKLNIPKSSTTQELYISLSIQKVDPRLIERIKYLNDKFEEIRFMPGKESDIETDFKELQLLVKDITKI